MPTAFSRPFITKALISSFSALSLYLLYKSTSSSHAIKPPNHIPSPLKTLLPSLSPSEIKELPYPPDIFPGARDVESPYGSLRVYEWGPPEGRKVLLVHGISTMCVSLGGLAEGLAEKGCRVMLLDLWGRGWSDTPLSLPHDTRLYTTAILLAVTSSPIPWTSFSLIGYSFGGGIAASFTSYFPNLVDSLVLIAPGGLIRPHHFTRLNKLLYSTGLFPEWILEWLARRKLSGNTASNPVTSKDADAPVAGEIPSRKDAFDTAVLSKRQPEMTVAKAVAWQLQYHQGFISSYMSSIRYGPISTQHEEWRRISKQLAARKSCVGKLDEKPHSDKVLIVCGKSDPIINVEELMEDAKETLGPENVRFEVCDAGHELPITKSQEIVSHIWDFWGVQVVPSQGQTLLCKA